MKPTLTLIVLFLVVKQFALAQTEDYKKIESALTSGDVEALMAYAPDENFGTVEFSTPGSKPDGLNKDEFSKQLNDYFDKKAEFEYQQLFNDKVQFLPMIVGKFFSGKQREYVIIGMADFGGFYRYLSFQITKKLPSNMNHLDK